ncbi:hypothetical protein GW884_01415 [Candidatus Falkowbacteria bacterium]|nr:hypothetical protein [Candidatus Falkowbacteria bacterium]
MSSVSFFYTKRQEKKYCLELFKEKDWFKSERFPVFLPQNITDIEKEISDANKLLKQNIIRLRKTWKQFEKKYFQIVKTFHYGKLSSRYICYISCFGPQGKYCHPNKLYIRLRTKDDINQAPITIGHELLHLIFYDFFKSKKLNYYECEGMVDALILSSNLSKIFPRYQKQSIGKVRYKLLKKILS